MTLTFISVVRWMGVAAVLLYAATRVILSRRRRESIWLIVFEILFWLYVVWLSFALQEPS